MKVILAGGTGFLGTALIKFFMNRGDHLVVLTRGRSHQENGLRWVHWDASTTGSWTSELKGADVLVNLVGRNVNCRYNESNKKEILESRVRSVETLSKGLFEAGIEIPLWIQASSATIYRHAEDRPMTEYDGETGSGFSVEVCKAWEDTFSRVQQAKRKVLMRTAIVLGNEGGAWPLLRRLTRLGFGGRMGRGSQYVSWLHESDFVKITEWLISNSGANGVYNCTAPQPLSNRDVMRAISNRFNPIIGLPSPEWLLRIGAFGMRTETELILKSRWVLPTRLLNEGFQFDFPTLEQAVQNLT